MLGRLVWGPPYGQVTAESGAPICAGCCDRGLLLPDRRRGTVVTAPRGGPASARRAARTGTPSRCRPPVDGRPPTHRPQVVDANGGRAGVHRAVDRRGAAEGLGRGRPAGAAGGRAQRTGPEADRGRPRHAPSRRPPSGSNSPTRPGCWPRTARPTSGTRPTPAYDEWLELPARRAVGAARGGLADGDPYGRAGRRTGRQGPYAVRARPGPGPLGRARGAPPGPALLAGLPEGTSPPPESVLARLRWERPLAARRPAARAWRRPARPARALDAVRGGDAGRDGPGRAVRARPGAPRAARTRPRPAPTGRGPGDKLPAHHAPAARRRAPLLRAAEQAAAAAAAARLLAPLLPEPLDHVLLQADLTAVAPGPLQRPLGRHAGACSRTWSRRAGRRSTASRPAPCAAPWTPAGPPPTCTPSSPSTPARRSRSRSPT